ncbi:GNAT family protein [Maritalea porphyrae]|jgi:RimJ/RimL family protein N-acetyltransferase|uniref:GNAT family N-acetyltransferase n=1 Tax=Maritalea porphyrae TaxID=880732 RepID=UPI0022B0018F|nr:GNAT family protein [Maritalea porphyrae]MCZ4271799.1 GNAT family protein [Maritalea porphyrae]
MIDIALRDLRIADLRAYRQLISPDRAFHQFNGPYFGLPDDAEQDRYIQRLREKLEAPEQDLKKLLIIDARSDRILGEVSWYWRSKATYWMEIGILIFNQSDWSKGIGANALKLLIGQLFADRDELVRIGLTTWSGNQGMMRLAQKLGMRQEACYRKARFWQGQYYDSVSYGVLKEEWSV